MRNYIVTVVVKPIFFIVNPPKKEMSILLWTYLPLVTFKLLKNKKRHKPPLNKKLPKTVVTS